MNDSSYRLFDLVYSDYDWQEHYFFAGPDEATCEDFEKLCNSLLPKAGYKATLKRSSPKIGGWVSWGDVVESLVSMLEEYGYQQVSIDSYEIDTNGGIIGLYNGDGPDEKLGFSSYLISNYNRKLERKMAEEREAKRALKGLHLKKKVIQIIK